jgi:hypothetical protein
MFLPFALALALQATAAQPCAADAALPKALTGWRQTTATPVVGKAFAVQGRDPATVRGLTASDLARGGAAALVPIQIATGGAYHVALSDGAWIDMMAGGMTLPSVGHAKGPVCSGIHKIVDFRLQRGRYALHLSGMKTPSVRVLIARA